MYFLQHISWRYLTFNRYGPFSDFLDLIYNCTCRGKTSHLETYFTEKQNESVIILIKSWKKNKINKE